jgi:hypothetical protein
MLKDVRAVTMLVTWIALGASAAGAQTPGTDILTLNPYTGGYSPYIVGGRDVVSSFDRFGVDRTQHDIIWTAGLTVSF